MEPEKQDVIRDYAYEKKFSYSLSSVRYLIEYLLLIQQVALSLFLSQAKVRINEH
jgi:hypothetical protein